MNYIAVRGTENPNEENKVKHKFKEIIVDSYTIITAHIIH